MGGLGEDPNDRMQIRLRRSRRRHPAVCEDGAVEMAEQNSTRALFDLAVAGLTDLVAKVGADQWDRPGLGEWTVRDLLGHTSLTFTHLDAALRAPAPGSPDLADAAAYFAAARSTLADRAALSRRGQKATAALGADPAPAFVQLASRACDLTRQAPDDTVLATYLGSIGLLDYLTTRVWELTVHALDLARATGLERPAALAGPVRYSLVLTAELVANLPIASDLLLLITGRENLPPRLLTV
jgi:uncharacterized protein (TIGR03083 family)